MNTCLDRPWRLALLVIVATTCLAGCGKGQKDSCPSDSYTGPVYDPIQLDREDGIADIEFSEDGRQFCFIDAQANVGVVDLKCGQLLWSRRSSPYGEVVFYNETTEWASCHFLNEDGDLVARHTAYGKNVSIVPVDPDKPVTLFQASGKWSDLDYARLSKAFVENRHAVDLSGIEGGNDLDRDALTQDLDQLCEYLTVNPELWQKLWMLCGPQRWESADASVALSLLDTVELSARERVFRDRALGNRLAKTEVHQDGAFWIGVVDVHGKKGVLASSPNTESMLSIYSPNDGDLMWWFVGPTVFELEDLQGILGPHMRELDVLRLAYPKIHRYIDRGSIEDPVALGEGLRLFEKRSPTPNVMEVCRKDGKTYICMGERHMPGYNFLTVGLLENDVDIDWRTLETHGVRKFAADGFQVLVLYAEGRIALWDMSKDGGGNPKRLAEGQAVESQWREDETAVGYRDGHGVVSINDQYWIICKNEVTGPFTARGSITAIAIHSRYWVYGTADGKIIFDRLD